jgi:hypothetical protein
MDGRDLARCISTEKICGVDVYTVSQEKGAVYREDRHLDANFNRHDFVKNLRKRFGEDCCFDEIILDYFWIPQGWDASHWSKSFFEKTLVSFAAENMLREETGAIYLPFCLHCFKSVRMAFHKLKQYFNVSFIRKNELSQVSLWKGTQGIDPFNMQHFLGKKLNQEDIYCTFGPRDVAEAMEDSGISKSVLVKLARSLEDFHSIRFICLTLLPGKRPALTKKTFGSYIGCIAPSKVERGFYQMELDSSSNIKAETNIISCTPARRSTYETKPQTPTVRRCLFPAEESGYAVFVPRPSNSEISMENTVATSLRNRETRGRHVNDTPISIADSEQSRGRRRGRPPKNAITPSKKLSIDSPSSKLINTIENPRARKRGRPPENDIIPSTKSSVESPSSNLINIIENPRARKRGRPPKNDMNSSKSSSIGSPSSNSIISSEKPPTRKRGRPPKSCVTSNTSSGVTSPSLNSITISEETRARKRGRPPKSSIGAPSVRDSLPAPAIVTPMGTPDVPGSPISNENKRSRSQSPSQILLSPQALFSSCLISNTFDAMPRHYFDVKSQGEVGNSSLDGEVGCAPIEIHEDGFCRVYEV